MVFQASCREVGIIVLFMKLLLILRFAVCPREIEIAEKTKQPPPDQPLRRIKVYVW